MKLKLQGPALKMVGAVRLTVPVYNRIVAIAKRENCSMQDVIRAILVEFIDQVD